MSYFSAYWDGQQEFEILTCHINLWSLKGFLRRVFFFDVGLHLKVGPSNSLQSFYITLPFGTPEYISKDKKPLNNLSKDDEKPLYDLSDQVLKKNVAQLLFGGNVQIKDTVVSNDSNVNYKVSKISVPNSVIDKDRSGDDYSCWKIYLAREASHDSELYIRMRFEAINMKRIWIWKSGRQGSTIDFRICDTREVLSIENWADSLESIAKIHSLYAFFILPLDYYLRLTSPGLRYMRLLEGSVWEEYLIRKTNIFGFGSEKLPIYCWGYPDKTASMPKPPISISNPFRIYADLCKDNDNKGAINYIFLSLIIFIVVVISNVSLNLITSVDFNFAKIVSLAREYWVALGALGIFGIYGLFRKAFDNITAFLKSLQFANKIVRNIEKKFIFKFK